MSKVRDIFWVTQKIRSTLATPVCQQTLTGQNSLGMLKKQVKIST